MIELIRVTNGVAIAYSYEQFRGDFNTTGRADKHLNPHGVYRVARGEYPDVTVGYKAVAWSFPQQVDGLWTQIWDVVPLHEEELRTERNRLLTETDWMAVTDRTISEVETAYRQGLRDIPQQSGFPDEIEWPALEEPQ